MERQRQVELLGVIRDMLQLLLLLRQRRQRRRGVHPMRQLRTDTGRFAALYDQLRRDAQLFHQYTRMDHATFDKLLEKVAPRLNKTSRREPISTEERLVVALRFLATGNTFRSLGFEFFMGFSTVAKVVHEVCAAIVDTLQTEYVRTPSTEDEWRTIAEGFYQQWDMPNCLGAIDGKHCLMRKPAKSGSLFYNYKGTFSTLLLAVADYRHKFIWTWVGNYGSDGDAGLYDRSDFGNLLNRADNPLHLPGAAPLPGTSQMMPFFIIGDGAFPLGEHLMKPFGAAALNEERRIFNYRLSRARRVVESAFGIMAARWRVLLKPMELNVTNSDNIVKAACCLHNFLIEEGDAYYPIGDAQLPNPRDDLVQAQIRRTRANRAPRSGETVRERLVRFFNYEGAIEFQNEMIQP